MVEGLSRAGNAARDAHDLTGGEIRLPKQVPLEAAKATGDLCEVAGGVRYDG